MEAISSNINNIIKKKLCLAIISHIFLVLIEIFKYMYFSSKIMLKKRNAQGLSITTIIIAVIGLVVIVILVAVFSGRMGQFGRNIDQMKQGSCVSVCSGLGKQSMYTANDGTAGNPVCGNDLNEQKVSGEFSDEVADKVCCCY